MWSYNIGDTIEFIQLNPYRIRVTGRIKHYISAFGEHVIAKEVEQALSEAIGQYKLQVNEFTVAPLVSSDASTLSRHEWFIEWHVKPSVDLRVIEQCIETSLKTQNSYYKDLVDGSILAPLQIRSVRTGGMRSYMQSKGKLWSKQNG